MNGRNYSLMVIIPYGFLHEVTTSSPKRQDGVGSSEIALRTDSARESTGYGQEQII